MQMCKYIYVYKHVYLVYMEASKNGGTPHNPKLNNFSIKKNMVLGITSDSLKKWCGTLWCHQARLAAIS